MLFLTGACVSFTIAVDLYMSSLGALDEVVNLMVLQVRLSCLLCSAEAAEVAVVAG